MSSAAAGAGALAPLSRSSPWLLLAVQLCGLVVIGVTGYLHYLDQKRDAELAARENIRLMAERATERVSRWLEEHRIYAATLQDTPVGPALADFLADPRAQDARHAMVRWLDALSRHLEHGTVILVDGEGMPVLAVPEVAAALGNRSLLLVRRAMARQRVVFSDLDARQGALIEAAVPLLPPRREQRGGALLLRIDPELSLYPLVRTASAFHATAEILLLRRDGDALSFLEPSSAAPALRLSPRDGTVPLTALLESTGGEALALDYRDVEVLAVMRRVHDSPWYVVAKVDRDAIHGPIRRSALRTVGIFTLLMLVVGMLGWIAWRYRAESALRQTQQGLEQRVQQRTEELQRVNSALRAEAGERQRAEQLSQLWGRALEATGNGIVITDATRADHPIIFANPAFERITGYREEEVLGRSWAFLYDDEPEQPQREVLAAAIRERREAQAVVRCFRKDGSAFWNEVSLAPVRGEAGGVSHFIGIMTDVTERKARESQMEFKAGHDTLTELPNRTLLEDRLSHAIDHAHRTGELVAVLFVDLDRFKPVNDTLGHAVGDALLRVVADRLRACVRAEDSVARIGGDEFVVMLEGLERPAAAEKVARKIMESLGQPLTIEGHALDISGTVGISLFPRDGTDVETLLRHADVAMYRAKKAGRNTFRFYG